jgi:hypothetical protein
MPLAFPDAPETDRLEYELDLWRRKDVLPATTVGPLARCGDPNCQTPLALSVTDEGVRL